jgi:hypothetical protein
MPSTHTHTLSLLLNQMEGSASSRYLQYMLSDGPIKLLVGLVRLEHFFANVFRDWAYVDSTF